MTDITQFLTARLDDDEAYAREASTDGTGQWRNPSTGVIDFEIADFGLQAFDDGRIAAHIARHDPARVLAEVAAKRERLRLYIKAKEALAEVLKNPPPEETPTNMNSYRRERRNIERTAQRFTAFATCVQLDAQVYADHPDYNPEWAQ